MPSAKKSSLIKAKEKKNDEFYTQLTDIEKELVHYRHHFKDAVVFCNCDDPEWSNFWKYFHLNFEFLGLKKLITTHYDPTEPTYKMEYEGGNDADITAGTITPLKTNGDFRSPECIELLKEATIICTNPPFSIAREFYPQLIEYQKKFIIIGDLNWITYKNIFPLLRDNKMWLGYNPVKEFKQPDGTIKKFGNKLWYTNLDIDKRHEDLDLIEHYSPEKYIKYENYDAIEVSKVLNIPVDYDGVMGVPISFLDKYCPEQFEILGISGDLAKPLVIDGKRKSGRFYINGKRMYDRIVIRRGKG
ncbi:MAG: adenine-specific methyltransferase EcoRI family protein [Bacteroidales bacterium]|nr:adenine-specific methyltransferase EcoRI family protein [Bacteroidales bacterium]